MSYSHCEISAVILCPLKILHACDAHITPSLFMDRLRRLGVELTNFDQSLIPIKTSKGDLIKRAKERGETLNITEDFLVQFLAFGNPFATKIFAMPDIVKKSLQTFLENQR